MRWTNDFNENNTILNMRVARTIGLYQILDPESPRYSGYRIIHTVVTVFLVYELIILTLCLFGIFYWINNIIQVILQLTVFANILFTCCKMIIIVIKTDEVRDSVEVACNDFMRYEHYENGLFRKYRSKALRTYVNTYVIACNFVLFVWSTSPLIFGTNNSIVLKSMDGTRHDYLLNAYNMLCIVPSRIHNQYFDFFYVVEVAFGVIFVAFMNIFDFYLISMCNALSNNLRAIGTAYGSFERLYSFDGKSSAAKISNQKILNDLKMIIKDHQNVLTKMEDFINIVRFVILGQLFVASQTIIFLLFVIVLDFYSGVLEDSAQSFKVCCAFPFFLFQLYLPCYLFQSINNEKDAVQFALYCSNWEEMDIKCKHMVLLAMRMNSSHKVYLKITIMKIVNFEMFSRAINLCYSIVSVMVNSMVKIKKTKKE